MQLVIDDSEQAHIYTCLSVGNLEFGKLKKSLAKLDRDVGSIDEEIALNAKLRRIFNPRAEDEARERSRAKDPSQLDLTEAGSSGETGGGTPTGQTFSLKTPADMTNEELRDALLELGLAVQLDSIELQFGNDTEGGWTDDQKSEVVSWIEAARAGQANDEKIPDAPEVVERDSITVARLSELLAAGPYSVREVSGDDVVNDQPFEVQREGAETIDSAFSDKIDAEIEAARLNRTELQRADMSDDEVVYWAGKGPWVPEATAPGGGAFIIAGTQRELCESFHEAMGRAARYNRSIAQRTTEPVEPMYEVANEQTAEAAVASEQEKEIVAAGRD